MKENYKQFSHKSTNTTEERCGGLLIEYRCDCGKLLFKGFMLVSVVEIKCKRCGKTKTFRDTMRGIRSFMFIVDDGGVIVDACEGVAVLGYDREHALGKSVSQLLPLVRDSHYQEIITKSEDAYHISNNMLVLRDRKVPLESHIMAVHGKKGVLYNVFNIIK